MGLGIAGSEHAAWGNHSYDLSCFPSPPWNNSLSARVLSDFSRVWLFVTPWTVAHQAPVSMGFSRQECWSGKNTGVGSHALLQGIFLTQGLNLHLLCLLHWQPSIWWPNYWAKDYLFYTPSLFPQLSLFPLQFLTQAHFSSINSVLLTSLPTWLPLLPTCDSWEEVIYQSSLLSK